MHRRYNRWWGRFDQPDPYDGSYDLADPQSFNRYGYVSNDPVNFTDPTGLDGHENRPPPLPPPTWRDYPGYGGSGLAGGTSSELCSRAAAYSPMLAASMGCPGYAGPASGGGPQNPAPTQQPNPNCIANAVAGGRLGTTRGLIPGLRFVPGRGAVPTGLAAHGGIHVYAPPGDPSAVTARPAMAGRILHSGRQAISGADYNLAIVDILLDTRINGQQYVMTLKDLNYSGAQLSGTVRSGSVIGSVNGSADMVGETGLHVTLMPYSTYQRYIGRNPSGAARARVPFNSLMDAARDPASPFRCP